MATQWRAGHLPYTTIWDNKPVGIYAIFALFQALTGGAVFSMRIATICFVATLACLVFRITEHLAQSRFAAWAAGTALVVCSLSNDGLSANTELFMTTFTAAAVLAALTTESALLVGLLLGCAFMIKYVAVFEAPVIFALFALRHRRGAGIILGAAIPLAAVMLLYALAGRFQLWLDCSVLSNLRRVSAPVTAGALHYAFSTQAWRWGPLYLAGIAMLAAAAFRRRGEKIFLAAWLLGGLLGVASAKSFYDHYFLQILPVLCVILGMWLAALPRGRVAFALAMLALPAWAAWIAHGDTTGPDVPREIAAALPPQARIYVFDSQPILYALTASNPPTRFVLPTELTGKFLPGVAGVDAPAEVSRILAGGPIFIIRQNQAPAGANPAVYTLLDQALTAHYTLWRQYPGVRVYRLTTAGAP
jgi:4-amino-4-deoxy-L-arabinose transferase-like glycosyltransferase